MGKGRKILVTRKCNKGEKREKGEENGGERVEIGREEESGKGRKVGREREQREREKWGKEGSMRRE